MTANKSDSKQGSLDNLKLLRSDAYRNSEDLVKLVKGARKKLDIIYRSIDNKERELYAVIENRRQAEEEAAANEYEAMEQFAAQNGIIPEPIVADTADFVELAIPDEPEINPKNVFEQKTEDRAEVTEKAQDVDTAEKAKANITDTVETPKPIIAEKAEIEVEAEVKPKVQAEQSATSKVIVDKSEAKDRSEISDKSGKPKKKPNEMPRGEKPTEHKEAAQRPFKQSDVNAVDKPTEKAVEKPAKAVEAPAVKAEPVEAAQKATRTEDAEAAVVGTKQEPTVRNIVTDGVKMVEKTYVDDKGNVRTRRFIDTSKPAFTARAPREKTDRFKRDGTQDTRAPREGGRYNDYKKEGFTPRTGTTDRPPRFGDKPVNNKDSYGKDDDAVKRDPKKPTVVKKFNDIPVKDTGKTFGNKNKTPERNKDEKGASKRIKVRAFDDFEDEDRIVNRKLNKKKDNKAVEQPIKKIESAVVTGTDISIKDLSEKTGVAVGSLIKELFKENVLKGINDRIDFTLAEYIAGIFGVTLTQKLEKTAEEVVEGGLYEDDGLVDDQKRPPIVTIMGHVDHGKTSLLDAIRQTNVTQGEAGGITQHIGAYQVTINDEPITFIDTPGHEAFTAMRARGAQVTDIAVIVVAADDGVMPQTIEAINHAKAANVPIIVAINKMDKPQANPNNVMTQLTEYGLVSEEWGGDTIMVPVSAKAKTGIKELLESILVVAEVKELKANSNKKAKGTVIEAKLDKNRGPLATLLIQNGTLHVGDYVVAGMAAGKVKAMSDDKGKYIKVALPGTPVEVLGFSDVPNAGDFIYSVDEKLAKQVVSERKDKEKVLRAQNQTVVSLDDVFNRINEENMKVLNIIIKCDVQGTMEALKSSLVKISNEEVRIVPIHGGVGAITENDVMLAKASNAIIIGFNVRADSNARNAAEREGVDIRIYSIIYDAVDDITKAMKGMLAPKFKDEIIGQIQVREVFKISNIGTIAGCYVTQGKVTKTAKVRVYRNDVLVANCEILSLRRFKDDVKEVAKGNECGIGLVNYNDIKVDDIYEVYQTEEVEA
ncbi:MAG: translation initiation factor IF-2 [Clostridia bacterium]|nr:translation initiation factor IF-2 [Clostridia bacterium]